MMMMMMMMMTTTTTTMMMVVVVVVMTMMIMKMRGHLECLALARIGQCFVFRSNWGGSLRNEREALYNCARFDRG